MRRIMIFGGSGSGKSTLAQQIGAVLGLPVVHIDRIYWLPGWEMRAPEDVIKMIRAEIAAPEWIFEGNHSKTLDERAALADLIIYLDMPLRLRLWRFTKRWWTYRGQTRPDMTEGCNERWDPVFVRDFIWRHRRDKRPQALAHLDRWRSEGRRVVHLQSPRAVRLFLDDLREGR